MKILILAIVLNVFFSSDGEARPISYPGGWTVMIDNNGDTNSLHTHYSPSVNYSVGLRNEYDRNEKYQMHSLQLNNLIKRWNNKDSQANIYALSGAGYALKDNSPKEGASFFTGISADWEDRDYFIQYENRFIYADTIDKKYTQMGRIGITPYVGDFGDVHTWLMLQIDHNPTEKDNDHFTFTPLVRLFYDTHLLETGYSDKDKLMFNYIKRF